MKNIIISLFLAINTVVAQQTPFQSAPVPDALKPAVAIISKIYSNIDQKKPATKPPSDGSWIFRAPSSIVGTVEVGFQGTEVLYMVFRRGTGGHSWKLQEIQALYAHYRDEKLLDPKQTYIAELAPPINGAIIVRRDFNKQLILRGN